MAKENKQKKAGEKLGANEQTRNILRARELREQLVARVMRARGIAEIIGQSRGNKNSSIRSVQELLRSGYFKELTAIPNTGQNHELLVAREVVNRSRR